MLEFCVGTESLNLYKEEECIRLREQDVTKISVSCELLMEGGRSRSDVEKLAVLLQKTGLSPETCHPPFGSYNELFSIINQRREQRSYTINWMKELTERCGLLNIKAIPLHTGGAMLPDSQDWEIALAFDYVSSLLNTAEKTGVRIAVENTNHARPINWLEGVQDDIPLDKNIWEYDDTEKIIRFVTRFQSKSVGICYDTGHSHLLGKVIEDMEAFKENIVLFHLHDNDGAYNDSHWQPGYGNTPWFELFDRIERQGYKDVPGSSLFCVGTKV